MSSSRHKGWYWGHPDCEPIDSKEFVKEKEEVTEIVQMNHDNPAIQQGVIAIDEWLKEAYDAKYYLYKQLLGRLWDIGVRGTNILVKASAIRLFRFRNPNRFIDDRHYIHVLGNKIIRIVPYWGQTRGYEHNGIGMSVIRKLAGVDISVCKAVIQGKKQTQQIKNDMSIPLEF